MNPCVVTFVSDRAHSGFVALHKSCQRWGWDVIEVYDAWNGEGHRLKAVLRDVDDLRKRHTHLVHVDAFDVLAVGPPSELQAALNHYGNPSLLLSCEAAVWPSSREIQVQYGERTSHWFYAHSQFVLDLTQPRPAGFGDLADEASDQEHLHKLYLSRTPGVVLDRECRVVQSLAHSAPWQKYFKVEGDRVRNLMHNTLPLFAHGNGRTPMDWVPQ